jgi:uncharacterized protein (TIGR00369 family)
VETEDEDMERDAHFDGLKRMYESAPCNVPLGVELTVREAEADIRLPVTEQLFHAAGAVHGSFYFKVLDDACYFAANSLVPDVFVLTVTFHLQLLRPITSGVIRSFGRVTRPGKTLLFAEAIAYGEGDAEVARGSGVFSRGPLRLIDVPGYAG